MKMERWEGARSLKILRDVINMWGFIPKAIKSDRFSCGQEGDGRVT